jgi:hypothetical protein
LQIFFAALEAVEVVGPTLPDSWAEQPVARIKTVAATELKK